MTKIGLFRCTDNEKKCPLTNCFKCMQGCVQGFAQYGQTQLAGVFTLQNNLQSNIELAKIMKAKGAEAIHLVTCAFAHKVEGKKWILGDGFIKDEDIDSLAQAIADNSGLPCIKGAAHLPEGYTPEVFA